MELFALLDRLFSSDRVVMNLIVILGMIYLVVFLHECGHLIAALAVRRKVTEFNMGRYPRLQVGALRGCSIVLGVFPGGRVAYDPKEKQALWKRAIVTAAGPFMSLAVSVAIFAVGRCYPLSDLVSAYALLSAIDFLGNILPIAPDGRNLLGYGWNAIRTQFNR